MAMPAFVSKGTVGAGFGDICAGTWEANTTLPATINAGDIIVLFVGARCPTGTIDSFDTPSGYTAGESSGVGEVQAAAYFYKVAAGTEDSSVVNLTGTFFDSIPSTVLAQSYVFSGSGTGGFHAVGGSSSGSGTTPSLPAVTTTEANELAVGLIWAAVSTTINSSSGESGGDWIEAASEDTGTNRLLQCQTANMASAGTITGGSSTLGSSGAWRSFSFALKEIGAATKAPPANDNLRRFRHLLVR